MLGFNGNWSQKETNLGTSDGVDGRGKKVLMSEYSQEGAG
jgi:hypothetical protein